MNINQTKHNTDPYTEVERLENELERINSTMHLKNRSMNYVMGAGFIFFVSIFALFGMGVLKDNDPFARFALGCAFLVGGLCCAFALFTELKVWIQCRRWNKILTVLLEHPRRKMLPTFLRSLEAYRTEHTTVQTRHKQRFNGALEEPLWSAITHELKRVEEADKPLFAEAHHTILHGILRYQSIYQGAIHLYEAEEPKLLLAIMAALSKIGDSRDLPTLRDVASGKIPEIASSVRQEAEQAITTIQFRMGGEKAREELLRASGANAGTDQLLRAASYSAVSSEKEMLRASDEPQPNV